MFRPLVHAVHESLVLSTFYGAEVALMMPSDYLPVADGKFQTRASIGVSPKCVQRCGVLH